MTLGYSDAEKPSEERLSYNTEARQEHSLMHLLLQYHDSVQPESCVVLS